VAHDGWGGTTGDARGSGAAGRPDGPPPGKRAAPWATPAPPPGPSVSAGPPVSARPPVSAAPPVDQAAGRVRSGGAGRRILGAGVVVSLAAAAVAITWIVQREDPVSPEPVSAPAYGAPLSRTPAEPSRTASEDRNSTAADDRQESSGPATSSSSSAPRTSASPSPAVMTEMQALDALRALRRESLSGLALDSRWVAQVASKSVGITDPLQVAANGTNTFFAVDILAESRSVVASLSSPVLVLQSTDFGKRSWTRDGEPYWVTLVDGGFGSSDAVKAWCARTYADLTPEQLANACAARTLAPPHD
jgi:hypothetical protein